MTAPLLTSLAAPGDDRPDALSVGGRAGARAEQRRGGGAGGGR
ncbi:hypothetical protein [Streptomyces sp. NPDC059455]